MKKVTDLKEDEGIVCRSKQEAKQIRQLMHNELSVALVNLA